MKKLISWLLKKPVGGVSLRFDRAVLFIAKIGYLVLRFSLLIMLGKRKRDKLFTEGKIPYFSEYFSPSFFLSCYILKPLNILNIGNFKLLKVSVPKYQYKIYCPVTKDDFINVTVREEDILERFTPKEGDTVIDVGAHIGRYTLIGAKHVGENGKIVAIEANPSVYNMLQRNIKLNNLTNVIPLNYAVYSKQTKIKLYIPDQDLDPTIYNTIISDRASKEGKFVEVNANTIDNILQENRIPEESVNWIKIDVEGAEFEVLKGATNVLSKSKDISLLIEVHNIDKNKNNFYNPIMDLLGSYNFRIEFEQTYSSGEKHLITKKMVNSG